VSPIHAGRARPPHCLHPMQAVLLGLAVILAVASGAFAGDTATEFEGVLTRVFRTGGASSVNVQIRTAQGTRTLIAFGRVNAAYPVLRGAVHVFGSPRPIGARVKVRTYADDPRILREIVILD